MKAYLVEVAEEFTYVYIDNTARRGKETIKTYALATLYPKMSRHERAKVSFKFVKELTTIKSMISIRPEFEVSTIFK